MEYVLKFSTLGFGPHGFETIRIDNVINNIFKFFDNHTGRKFSRREINWNSKLNNMVSYHASIPLYDPNNLSDQDKKDLQNLRDIKEFIDQNIETINQAIEKFYERVDEFVMVKNSYNEYCAKYNWYRESITYEKSKKILNEYLPKKVYLGKNAYDILSPDNLQFFLLC